MEDRRKKPPKILYKERKPQSLSVFVNVCTWAVLGGQAHQALVFRRRKSTQFLILKNRKIVVYVHSLKNIKLNARGST